MLPLVKKYGGVLIALTLDENGIPQNSEDRMKIAQNIINEAKKYGISKKKIQQLHACHAFGTTVQPSGGSHGIYGNCQNERYFRKKYKGDLP